MLPARHNNWMPDIFNDFFDTNWMDRPKATAPAINVIETPEAYELELAAPGMTKEDFNVHLDEEGDLVINQQTMLLPEDANREDIAAKVEHGVLTVTIAKVKKVEPEKVHRQIEVQ